MHEDIGNSKRERPIHASVEEAWINVSGEVLPTIEEIEANPMQALRAFFYAGAVAALDMGIIPVTTVDVMRSFPVARFHRWRAQTRSCFT